MKEELHSTPLPASMALPVGLLRAQTRITPPTTSTVRPKTFKLGREAAAEIEKQLPLRHADTRALATGVTVET